MRETPPTAVERLNMLHRSMGNVRSVLDRVVACRTPDHDAQDRMVGDWQEQVILAIGELTFAPAGPATPTPPLKETHVRESTTGVRTQEVAAAVEQVAPPRAASEGIEGADQVAAHLHRVAGPATPTPEGRDTIIAEGDAAYMGIGRWYKSTEEEVNNARYFALGRCLGLLKDLRATASGPAVSPQPEPPREGYLMVVGELDIAEVIGRATQYFQHGGLWNPELMSGKATAQLVSDLVGVIAQIQPPASSQPPAVPVQDPLTALVATWKKKAINSNRGSSNAYAACAEDLEAALRREPPAIRNRLAHGDVMALVRALVAGWDSDDLPQFQAALVRARQTLAEAVAPQPEPARDWLIFDARDRLWWKPNAQGYTPNIDEAGRFTEYQAKGYESFTNDRHDIAVPAPLQETTRT